jgi:hypothetical protein
VKRALMVFALALVYAWVIRALDVSPVVPAPSGRRGILDDDGVPRGERWDGGVSDPRAAASPASSAS